MSKTKTLYVICDANHHVGFGHFFRCLHIINSLNRQAPWLHIHWLGNISTTLQHKIIKHDYCKLQDASMAIGALPAQNAYVLSDSYLLTEQQLSALALKHTLLAIDDFASFDYEQAAAVLNFTVSAQDYRYAGKAQLLGPDYFVCSPELDEVRELKLLEQKPLRKVLIAMGGFDRFAAAEKIAVALHEHSPSLQITVLGRLEHALPSEIQHIDYSNNMAPLYRHADLIISGGGLIKYESAYCATPNIAVSQTLQQWQESQAFAELGLCINYGMAAEWKADSFIEWFVGTNFESNFEKQVQRCQKASKHAFNTGSTDVVANKLATIIGKPA